MLSQLVKFLYSVSDFFGWLMSGIFGLAAIAYPITGSVYNQINHQPESILNVVFHTAILATLSILAWLVAKRKKSAVLLLAAILSTKLISMAMSGGANIVFFFGILLVSVIVLPVIFSFIEFYIAHEKT